MKHCCLGKIQLIEYTLTLVAGNVVILLYMGYVVTMEHAIIKKTIIGFLARFKQIMQQ